MIDELNIKGFTCFDDNTLVFSKNVNVFIGQNGTGKTHILKLIASMLSTNDQLEKSSTTSKEKFENLIAEQLVAFFKPEQLGRLVRRQQGRTAAKIAIKFKDKNIAFGFSNNSKYN